jgi:hypothetical protein
MRFLNSVVTALTSFYKQIELWLFKFHRILGWFVVPVGHEDDLKW